MHKQIATRIKALTIGAVMAATSIATTSFANVVSFAAAGSYSSASSIGKTLDTAEPDESDPDTPLNQADCTFMCKDGTDEWTAFTDTTCGPADFLGTSSITSLQFNLSVPSEYDGYIVSKFTYYYGMSSTTVPAYYWDIEAVECTPFASSFSVVVQIPSSAKADWTNKFQFQNCYAQLINESGTEVMAAPVVLDSITANGKTDTSNGEDPGWGYTPGETAKQNTGGLWYSSANYSTIEGYSGDNVDFKDNGDGTATITTLNSLKLDDIGLLLTTGDNCSEEYYQGLDPDKYSTEAAIREDGQPLNSHKFTYGDFGLNAGVNSAVKTTVKSLSVTLSVDDDTSVTRVMYGGGLNVTNMSPADTEYAKYLAGLKEGNATNPPGYWYNDIGSDVYAQVLAYEEETGESVFDIDVEGGSDLAKQEKGSYFTVTWDVPEEVQPYEKTGNSDSISFQLWFMEFLNADPSTISESKTATIESAVLTYEESVTIPYTASASVSSTTKTNIGDTVEIPYADFNMEYEKTSDIYAIQYDIITDVDVNQLLVGGGTSVIEKANQPDNWYQYDNQFANGKPILVNWEETTVDDRPDPADSTIEVAPYEAATGKNKYTFVWLIQNGIQQKVSTENEEYSHLSFGAYYGDLGETQASSYTLSNVTVYYKADDESNTYKTDLREGDLIVAPESMSLIEGTSSQAVLDADGNVTYDSDNNAVVGDDAIITVNVEGCTVKSSSASVQAVLGADGNITLTAKDNSAGTSSVITITTPGGQVATVEVTVVDSVDPNGVTTTAATTETTDSTTTTTTTTTAATTTDTTTTEGPVVATLYGDVTLDGDVNMADVIMLSKYAVGIVDLVPVAKANADVYYDGDVGGNDALVLLKFQVGMVDVIGPGANLDDLM